MDRDPRTNRLSVWRFRPMFRAARREPIGRPARWTLDLNQADRNSRRTVADRKVKPRGQADPIGPVALEARAPRMQPPRQRKAEPVPTRWRILAVPKGLARAYHDERRGGGSRGAGEAVVTIFTVE